MANSLLSSPVNPHFFKPLLPGFKTHLSIPEAFYSKHLEGREEGNTATLRSDASEITWKVTMDGRRLTHGWEKFALAHNLKVGDILVFRHQGNLMFHATPFGPSCCEIPYSHDDQNQTGKLIGNSKVKKKNPIKDETFFVVPVTASNLRLDSVRLPKGFTTSSGLSKLCNEITLMDAKGRSSTLELKYHNSNDRFCVRRGWRAFCCKNGHKPGGFLRLILVPNGKTPILRTFPLERDEDSTGEEHESAKEKKNVGSHESAKEKKNVGSHESAKEKKNVGSHESGKEKKNVGSHESAKEKKNVGSHESAKEKKNVGSHESAKEKKNVESSSLSDDSSFVVSVTVTNLGEDRLFLPMRFSRSKILNEGFYEIDLMNKQGRTWTLSLRNRKSSGHFYITGGWRSFCEANGQKAGCSFSFKLVRYGTDLVLLMN